MLKKRKTTQWHFNLGRFKNAKSEKDSIFQGVETFSRSFKNGKKIRRKVKAFFKVLKRFPEVSKVLRESKNSRIFQGVLFFPIFSKMLKEGMHF